MWQYSTRAEMAIEWFDFIFGNKAKECASALKLQYESAKHEFLFIAGVAYDYDTKNNWTKYWANIIFTV